MSRQWRPTSAAAARADAPELRPLYCQVRFLLLDVLRAAGGKLLFSALLPAMRTAQISQIPWEIPGCRRDCLRFALPAGPHLHQTLLELDRRGDLRYSARDVDQRRGRFKRGTISLLSPNQAPTGR